MRAIVLFAHGARDPEWARPFESIREQVRASRPEYPIELAFLDFLKPTLEEAIDRVVGRGATAITVFPMFMAQGGHLKNDLPRILEELRARHPRVPIALESALGDAPELTAAMAAWILSRAA